MTQRQSLTINQTETIKSASAKKANLERMARGRSIVHSNRRYKDSTNTLGDVLRDLMHWADLDGHLEGHFEKELEYAKRSFADDKARASS